MNMFGHLSFTNITDRSRKKEQVLSVHLPKVSGSEHAISDFLQNSMREPSLSWEEIRKELCPVKVSLQLRGEDGSVWNYTPPDYRDGKEIIPMLPHLADMSTYMFKGIINFAKVISYFRDLPIEDQISLLKRATFEMWVLRFNTLFNSETGTWECGRLVYCFEDPEGGFQKLLLDPTIKFHYMLRKLQLHKEESPWCRSAQLSGPATGEICPHPEGLH
ncbi:nuclear receptor subfamily 1 group I member 2-like [Perognathus longimembris pacificus]|uniref:nuclear receptor subfamily 1 group I member 2-like n=1 Tax=Perognathus longimembris pacificus TaxID=214514 RepID=UPI002019FD34|nr:nuclear receptor subfamily 1 group I member 2-like [Perognathus longimembris pacificus]